MVRQQTSKNKWLTYLVVAVSLIILVIASIWLYKQFKNKNSTSLPKPTQTAYTRQKTSPNNNFYKVVGKATKTHTARARGQVDYCRLDKIGRATCAVGEITPELREKAKKRGRITINANPAGWGKNVKVKYPNIITGLGGYNGWLWNRSHLVADSLGGEPIKQNLVTATRAQNVGYDGEGGMAYTENLARGYLESPKAKDCSLYYSAEPHYIGNELKPDYVEVNIQSCDKSIDEKVLVYNNIPIATEYLK